MVSEFEETSNTELNCMQKKSNIKFAFMGDIALGGEFYTFVKKHDIGFLYPFEEINQEIFSMLRGAKLAGRIPEYWLYWTYLKPEWFKTPLHSTEGHTVSILHPGRRNEDNGPDFLEAVVEIDGLRCRGDVEFHICAEDWFRHGHQQDQRYRNVVLHILWDARGQIPENLSARFPHILLRLASL